MKKKLLIVLLIFSTCFVGCTNSKKNKEKNPQNDNLNLSVYETQYYDKFFKHTQQMIITYDESGNFKKFEFYITQDDVSDPSCDNFEKEKRNNVDYNYPEVVGSCTVNKNKVKFYYSMTEKSIEAGYLREENKNYLAPFAQLYKTFETEEKAKESIEDMIKSYKENNIECNDVNYIVINGERKNW